MKVLVKLSLTTCLLLIVIEQVQSRGKTYDDLDDILRKDGLNSTKTHHAYITPFDEGLHIDPSKVVHVKQYQGQIQEEKAVTSGIVIPKAYTNKKLVSSPSSNTSSSSNQTKTYNLYAAPAGNFSQSDIINSLPLKSFKLPKRDKDAQFYFFLSTLLLLATTITIISSCGCLFYFMLKTMVSMQQRMVFGDDELPNQRVAAEMNQNQNQSRVDQFRRFDDEED